jgi:hypothetical protein
VGLPDDDTDGGTLAVRAGHFANSLLTVAAH